MSNSLLSARFSFRRSFPRWSILAFLLILGLLFYYKNGVFIWSDAEGYYLYLPAWFVVDGFQEVTIRTPGVEVNWVEATGKFYDKYTFGVALLQLPFFLIGHLFLSVFQPEVADGFSSAYDPIVQVAAVVYGFVGLFFLQRILERYFSFRVVSLTLLALTMGTNLFYYFFREPGMSHAYSFFLFSAALYFLLRWYDAPSIKKSLGISIPLALAIFIRPTNVLLLLPVIFWKTNNWSDIKKRIAFWTNHIAVFLPGIGLLILLFSAQIAIWSDMRGSLSLFSYSQEPGFIFWKDPKILNVWFHVWNGLFVYSPILIFSLTGIILGWKNNKFSERWIGITFLLLSYIFGSWWKWNFGGAFGHRCFVEWLPLMALPLGAFYQKTFRWPLPGTSFVLLISFLFLYLTTGLAINYHSPWDGPGWTWAAYWEMVQKIFSL